MQYIYTFGKKYRLSKKLAGKKLAQKMAGK
jgi:hypothetical protein